MKTFKQGAIAAALGVGLLAASASHAVPLGNPMISGPNNVWGETSPGSGLLEAKGPVASQAQLAGVIDGIPFGVDNVELSKFGGPVATISGTGALGTATFSSLEAADWLANGAALVTEYVTAAAGSQGIVLDALQQAAIEAAFVAPSAALGGLAPWQLVSDPNIEFIDLDAVTSQVTVVLAGFLDASALFSSWFGIDLQGAQASEVVKVSYNGVTDYLYSFSAVDSGVTSADDTGSFTGLYEATAGFEPGEVPVPATLALLALGVGLMARRRA